ncbi:MAG: argininosuccinate lyase [Woeseiaceae bacterium]|nr:argininosuccinate lyase [Woeseiaceae bacterium]
MVRSPAAWLAALLLAFPGAATAHHGGAHDDFDYLAEINRASLVMLVEQGLVPADLAHRIADAIGRVVEEQGMPGAARSANYLDFEARLVELAGPEASRLHTGRSRQDIGSTYRRMALRAAVLDSYDALLGARRAVLDLAGRHTETIVPAYTHGVQAQPTSYAHYLLAFAAAFERDAARLEAAYARLNLSPLGAAALGTSGFALDRERLAELLGFDGVVENTYDANLDASVDSKIEVANALSISAVTIGQFMQNLHTQYHDPEPWILLAESETSGSSIMPQKRNPRPVDRARLLASTTIGNAHGVLINAHNTNSGMNDYRANGQVLATTTAARQMYLAFERVLANLVVDKDRALDEVDQEYSTMTEIADLLLREAGVPFRIGHHYASELTSYGRSQGKRPKQLTDAELVDLYEEAIGDPLPVPVERVREAMNPVAMVANRRGLGGPQKAEVLRMLAVHQEALEANTAWLDQRRNDLVTASGRLASEFARIR